jgi:hypothetical protein
VRHQEIDRRLEDRRQSAVGAAAHRPQLGRARRTEMPDDGRFAARPRGEKIAGEVGLERPPTNDILAIPSCEDG